MSKKDTLATYGLSGIKARSPIGIRLCNKAVWCVRIELKPMRVGVMNIKKDPFESGIVGLP